MDTDYREKNFQWILYSKIFNKDFQIVTKNERSGVDRKNGKKICEFYLKVRQCFYFAFLQRYLHQQLQSFLSLAVSDRIIKLWLRI